MSLEAQSSEDWDPEVNGESADRVLQKQASHRWRRAASAMIVNVASVAERADEALLPAVYRDVGEAFRATPTQLGNLTLYRALAQAATSPLAGILSDLTDRRKVIAGAAAAWAIATYAFGSSTSYGPARFLRIANGAALGIAVPAMQSLIADMYPQNQRGKAFGLMLFTSLAGATLAGIGATTISRDIIAGERGWRFAFHTCAVVSFITSILVYFYVKDPVAGNRNGQNGSREDSVDHILRKAVSDVKFVVSIPSFKMVVLQGIVGTSPWNAILFLTMWLQLLGFTDATAAMIYASFAFGSGFGGYVGGVLGDYAASISPNHGRIIIAQLSVASGLPCCYLLLCVFPRIQASATSFGLLLFTMGCLINWCQAGCNSPLFAEIVPVSMRSTIYAFDRSFEGAVAACAAPLVGIVAERVFGYHGKVFKYPDLENAEALGSALLYCMALPWLFCLIFYTPLHWLYAKDRERQQYHAIQ